MSNRCYNVLFLCTGNSARSILAEAILNRRSNGRFKAFSAGSHPTGLVNARVLRLLDSSEYATDHLRSKSWEEFSGPEAPVMDFVFTVCDKAAEEQCPVWPGHPINAHWGIPDPAAVDGSELEKSWAVTEAYRALSRRIELFLNMPVATLDRLSLQRELSNIGSVVTTTASANDETGN